MQNLADALTDAFEEPQPSTSQIAPELSTFMIYNLRRKVCAS